MSSSTTYRTLGALVSLITLAACGGDGGSTGPGTPGPGTPGGEMPDDWVGQWQGAISGTPFAPNRVPGPAPDFTRIESSVLGYAWAFRPDGGYWHAWKLEMDYAFGACIVHLLWQEEGTATLSGTTLTLDPESSRYTALHSCEPALDYDGPAGAEQQTFTATLESDEAGDPMLRLVYPDGNDLLLEYCEDCQTD